MSSVIQLKTGCVALVLCLNIGVDPPDVIKISPCARMECWIGELGLYLCSFLSITLSLAYCNILKSLAVLRSG